ncbi:MAG: hypothetical protein SFU56_19740 [Capsulimonadales bacterium]|nr:hypothetical protein [Capsulimonadales bacterium]
MAMVGLHTDLNDSLTRRLGDRTVAVPLTRIYRRVSLPVADQV